MFTFQEQLLNHLQSNPDPEPVRIFQRFSDNCAAQYNYKKAFEHLLVIEREYGVYNYTESGHGKDPQ